MEEHPEQVDQLERKRRARRRDTKIRRRGNVRPPKTIEEKGSEKLIKWHTTETITIVATLGIGAAMVEGVKTEINKRV